MNGVKLGFLDLSSDRDTALEVFHECTYETPVDTQSDWIYWAL